MDKAIKRRLKMLTKLQTFMVAEKGIPSLADIEEAIDICKKENCVVKIMWVPNTYAGWYDIAVTAEANAQDVYNCIPRVYGV